MKKVLLLMILPLVMAVSFTSCSSNDSENLTLESSIVKNYDYTANESQLLVLVNQYRVSQGLNELQPINHVSFKSYEHNLYMIEKKQISHDLFIERSNNLIQVLGAVRVGENLAYNFSSPSSALNAWINSPGHKKNLDGDYTHFGVSITIDPDTGKSYYTNMFLKR
ncbi:MAG: hypothetical protein ACI9XR_002100 [Flavobacterium sp.]|jgi:uncharacterized protein YkwD